MTKGKIISFVLCAIFVFSGCSNSDDESNDSPPNAKGIGIYPSCKEETNLYFWINDYVVQEVDEKTTITHKMRFLNHPYYRFTIDKLYEVMSECYPEEINDKNVQKWYGKSAEYFRSKASKYKYFMEANSCNDLYFFYRISDIDYNM